MLKRIFITTAAVFALGQGLPAAAADSWGLEGEQEATIEGKVVDVLCELTKDCPQQCGAGKRQLGIKTAKNELVIVGKDTVAFGGATLDLLPFCGKDVVADGLFTERFATKMYVAQNVKAKGAKDFTEANAFIGQWAKANKVKPDGDEAEEWFRHDSTVAKTLAKGGKLGVPE